MAKLTVRGLESLRPRDDAYKVVVERGLHIDSKVDVGGSQWTQKLLY